MKNEEILEKTAIINIMNMKSRPKLEYMDYFRGFVIVYIVAGHTLCWGKYEGWIFNLNNYLFSGGTFLFLFIAGFLFQYLSYKFEYKTYLKKKFINVILPSWFAIAPAAITLAYTCNDPSNYLYNKAFWVRLLNPFLWGQIVLIPLWFISMITFVFLLAPVLLKFFKSKVLWYSLLISGLIYTCMCYRFSIDFNRTLQANVDVSILQWNIKWLLFYFKSVLYFISSYMLGMTFCYLCDKYNCIIKNYSHILFKIFMISWVLCYFILVLVLKLDVPHSNVSRILLAAAMFCLFLRAEDLIKTKVWLHKILKFLSGYSFGIFFVHYYFLNPLFFHRIYATFDNAWYPNFGHNTPRCMFHSVGDFFLTLFGSILILFVIKKILLKCGVKNTRMFIGV